MYDRTDFFAAPLPSKMNSDKTVTLAVRGGTGVAPELAILRRSGHPQSSPFDCRPRGPVRVDVRARSTESSSSLQGAILAVAPDTDSERAQRLPMEVHRRREDLVDLVGTFRPTAAGDWRVWVCLRDAYGEVRTDERSLEVTSARRSEPPTTRRTPCSLLSRWYPCLPWVRSSSRGWGSALRSSGDDVRTISVLSGNDDRAPHGARTLLRRKGAQAPKLNGNALPALLASSAGGSRDKETDSRTRPAMQGRVRSFRHCAHRMQQLRRN